MNEAPLMAYVISLTERLIDYDSPEHAEVRSLTTAAFTGRLHAHGGTKVEMA